MCFRDNTGFRFSCLISVGKLIYDVEKDEDVYILCRQCRNCSAILGVSNKCGTTIIGFDKVVANSSVIFAAKSRSKYVRFLSKLISSALEGLRYYFCNTCRNLCDNYKNKLYPVKVTMTLKSASLDRCPKAVLICAH